jgi:hypothetical protein
MPVVPFIPLIVKAGVAVGGMIASKKAQSAAQQRSPEESTALTGAQQAAGNLQATGGNLIDTGQQTQRPATNYFDTLLRGNRAQMAQATAAPRAAISDIYSGAERGLEHSGVRGPQRDVAAGELNRQRAGQLSSLVTGVQPQAAAALTSIGQTQTSQGAPMLGQAGSIYSGLLGQGFQNRKYGREEGEKAGTGFGGLIFDMLKGTKYGGGGGTSTTPGSFGSEAWMNH